MWFDTNVNPTPSHSDKLSPDVIASRVNNMLVAMDTDAYTLGRRRKDQVRNTLLVSYWFTCTHTQFHAKETAVEDAEGELRLFSEELSQLTVSIVFTVL